MVQAQSDHQQVLGQRSSRYTRVLRGTWPTELNFLNSQVVLDADWHMVGLQKDGELKPGKKGISLRKVHWEKLCSCAQALLDEALSMKK